MRSGLTWVLTAPLLAVGVLTGHSLAYALTVFAPHERAHVLEESGHAYLHHATLLVAVCFSLAAAAFVSRALAVARGRRNRPVPAPVFAVLPPVAFLAQEYLERLLHSGELAWATALQPAVLVGLVLQIPIALATLALARTLAELADSVGRSFAQEPPKRLVTPLFLVPVSVDAPLLRSVDSRGWTERGPPARF